MRVKTPHQTRIHVSLSLNTIESLFDLAKYRFWSEFAGAFAAQVHSLCASVTAVYLPFFVFGRVLTRLD